MSFQKVPDPGTPDIMRFRIQRGAVAMGTDAALGTIEQIVVDRDTGELRALIVQRPDGVTEFELAAHHIEHAAGTRVYLDIGRADLERHPELARPYDPNQYQPVYQGGTTKPSNSHPAMRSTGRPILTDVEENAAEVTAPGVLPVLSPEPGLAPQTTPPPPPEHAPPLTEEASMPRQAWPKGAPGSDATCSVPAPQPGTLPGTTVMIADSLFAAGAEDTASVPRTCAQPASTAIQPEITPVRLVAAAGLWATIAADVALRRRGKKRARAGLVVRSARVFPHGSSTDGSTDAAEHAILRPQRRRYRTGTSRSPTRVRWFRRGFILGLSLAFLFAPESGARLRSQLASAGERRHEPNV